MLDLPDFPSSWFLVLFPVTLLLYLFFPISRIGYFQPFFLTSLGPPNFCFLSLREEEELRRREPGQLTQDPVSEVKPGYICKGKAPQIAGRSE